jgi:N4-gp56 family major capsid protein
LYQYAALQSAGAMGVEGENYVCIIDPFTHASLMHDEMFKALFVAAEQSGKESAVRNGYIGRIMNCNLYVTANAKEYADGGLGSTTDVYVALFIGKQSFGTVSMANLTPSLIMSAGGEGAPMSWDEISPVKIIAKNLDSGGVENALNQRASIGWKTSLDVQVLNSSWIRSLEHVNEASDD